MDVRTPCSIVELADLCGRVPHQYWILLRHMRDAGVTWSFHDDGGCFAIVGLYPLEGGDGEAWFMVDRASRAQLRALIRWMRLTLARLPYREIITIAVTPAGSKIAALAGFECVGSSDCGEVWSYVQPD